jgi:hypothetical protein
MNLRELLKSLHAVDEKNLDMDVMVSPHSGGYEGISHVSVLYVGQAVIHLAAPQPQEPPSDLWESQESGVSVVKPDDLKKVWQFGADLEARGQSGIISNSIYKSICSPGADVMSVWYRVSMLMMLTKMMPEKFAQWIHDGQPDDVVFDVAATFPMEKMQTGVVREGPPFDVEEFLRQIGART